jgi:hypothetical protein
MLIEGQPQAVRLWVRANPASVEAGARCEVVATLRAEGGGVVARDARPMPRSAAEWIAELPVPAQAASTAFLVETRVVAADGRAVFEQTPYRVVRVSARQRDAMAAWVDENQNLHLGGKAAFVLGIYNTSQSWNTPEAWEEHHVAKIAEAPLNLVIN